jgi:hypothetical protein
MRRSPLISDHIRVMCGPDFYDDLITLPTLARGTQCNRLIQGSA